MDDDLILKNKNPDNNKRIETIDGKPILEAEYKLPKESHPEGGFIHFFIADAKDNIDSDSIVGSLRVEPSDTVKLVEKKANKKISLGEKIWTCVLKDSSEESDILESEDGKSIFIHEIKEGKNSNYQEIKNTDDILKRLDSLESRISKIESELFTDDTETKEDHTDNEEDNVEVVGEEDNIEVADNEEMPAFEDVEYKDLECPECGEHFKTDIGLKVHRKVNHPEEFEEDI